MPTPKYLPELSSDQVIHTARCLLQGKNPKPKDAGYFSQWVDEQHFDGVRPVFEMSNLAGELLMDDEKLLYSDPDCRRDVLDTAIREVLLAVRDMKQTFSGSLVRLLLAAYHQELSWLVEQWDGAGDLSPTETPAVYEPQSVTAARHIIRSQEPPAECFLDDLHNGTRWFGRREDVENCLIEEDRFLLVYLPRTRDDEHDDSIRTALERGDNPTLSRHAIDEALRELFRKFRLNEKNGSDFDSRNMNLFHRFQKAIFDEMEALVKDWDSLNGGAA